MQHNAAQAKTMTSFGVTQRGAIRTINQDRYSIKEYAEGGLLLAVADGMGGHVAGERAAEIALESLQSFNADYWNIEEHLMVLMREANRRILDVAGRDASSEGMGTTLVATFVSAYKACWVHVGDSRLYVFRENALVQITDDHTLPGLLVKEGELSAEQARMHPLRNVLLNCLGRESFEVDAGVLSLSHGDLLLLSTDGLHDWLSEQEITAILSDRGELKHRLERLVSGALTAGGNDDITLVAAQL